MHGELNKVKETSSTFVLQQDKLKLQQNEMFSKLKIDVHKRIESIKKDVHQNALEVSQHLRNKTDTIEKVSSDFICPFINIS